MRRLPLALVGFLSALTATTAGAQSYPQPNPMYGPGPMAQGGYGPMPQGAYGPAGMPPAAFAQQGMPPAAYGYGGMPGGMPANGMYPPAAYGYGPAAGNMYASLPGTQMNPGPGYGGGYAGGYGPGPVQQAMYMSNAQNPGPSAAAQNQTANSQQSSARSQEYHGPQGQIAKANPPPMKLPPGVTRENGLLYYKGSASADVNYQQFPMAKAPGSPYRLASYQADTENSGGPSSPANMMTPGSNVGPNGGMQMNYGGQGSPEGQQGSGQCQQCGNQGQDCGGGCGCGWCHCCGCLYNLFHGSMFPGKVGYVWEAGYDNLAMTRNAPKSEPLLFNNNGDDPLDVVEFNANQLTSDWDYGGRLHVELIGPSGVTYQATYTKIATFVSNQGVAPDDESLIFPPADISLGGLNSLPGFSGVDEVFFNYTSAIQTGELNMIFPFGSFEFLAGYRYMQIDEHMNITAITLSSPENAFLNDSSLNRMNGGQIGALGRWQMFGMFDFDFDAKFAVMGDDIRTVQSGIDDTGNPVGLGPVTADKTRVSFVSELGLQGVVPIGSSFSFHAGYNVYFIDRVALAPNQFDFTNIATGGPISVNNHGDLVVQGVNVGFTAVW